MKTEKKKTILSFNVDNVIDIITNSSSELFVLNGDTKELVKEMISSVYPGYLSEYEEIKSTEDLTTEEIETLVSYKYTTWKDHFPDILGIPAKSLYSNYSERGEKYSYGKLSEKGIERLKRAMDPENKAWYLFSLDENPNWEKQEDLMFIGQRYHLG